MTSRKVVHIITGVKSGGAEHLLLDRARRTQHQMAVVSLTGGGPIGDQLMERGVPVHAINMTGNKDIAGLIRLTKLLRRMRPDVVHVHLYRSLLFGRLAARLARTPRVIATEHSAQPRSTEGRPATALVKLLYWLAERLGDVTIAVSSDTRDCLVRFWGLRPSRVVIVPNGVDVDALLSYPSTKATARHEIGITSPSLVLVTVGRLVAGKRVDLTIKALASLRSTGTQATLIVVGSGQEGPDLMHLAETLGVRDFVHFVGDQQDVRPFLRAADVYVSASSCETYGIAIVEGLIMGLPVVYTEAPAGTDLEPLADDGRLTRCGYDDEEIAEAVRRAATFPAGPSHVNNAVRDAVDIRVSNGRLDSIEAGPG